MYFLFFLFTHFPSFSYLFLFLISFLTFPLLCFLLLPSFSWCYDDVPAGSWIIFPFFLLISYSWYWKSYSSPCRNSMNRGRHLLPKKKQELGLVIIDNNSSGNNRVVVIPRWVSSTLFDFLFVYQFHSRLTILVESTL